MAQQILVGSGPQFQCQQIMLKCKNILWNLCNSLQVRPAFEWSCGNELAVLPFCQRWTARIRRIEAAGLLRMKAIKLIMLPFCQKTNSLNWSRGTFANEIRVTWRPGYQDHIFHFKDKKGLYLQEDSHSNTTWVNFRRPKTEQNCLKCANFHPTTDNGDLTESACTLFLRNTCWKSDKNGYRVIFWWLGTLSFLVPWWLPVESLSVHILYLTPSVLGYSYPILPSQIFPNDFWPRALD
jgi:hypothetical protein